MSNLSLHGIRLQARLKNYNSFPICRPEDHDDSSPISRLLAPESSGPRVLWPSGPLVGLLLTVVFAATAVPLPASAQFDQYTAPGRFDETRRSIEDSLEDAMKRAPWRLGRTYFEPLFELGDVAYIDNASGAATGEPKRSDLTAAVVAGIRAFRPVGKEAVLAAHAAPQYVWWQEQPDRRQLRGRYGAGLFGNLGRTGLRITATRAEASRIFSREVEQFVNSLREEGTLNAEVDLGAGIGVFAGSSLASISFPGNSEAVLADVALLDRRETLVRAGTSVHLSPRLAIRAGVESSTVDFDLGLAQARLANKGISPLGEITFTGTRATVSARVAVRELEPKAGSVFPSYRDETGRLQVSFREHRPVQLQLFASKNLVYAVDDAYAYFVDEAAGGAVMISLGSRAQLRVLTETGTNDYTPLDGLSFRSDDFLATGAVLSVRLGRFRLQLGTTRTRYESDRAGFDRTVTVFSSSMRLGTGARSPWA